MNIYRGCTHGCIYCDSRSICYQINHDFEEIEVKRNAPELLRKAIKSLKKPKMIGTGSMTDPYIPLELELKYTRKCIEIVYEYGCGMEVLTKSTNVLRDIDLFEAINARTKALVQMTLTTYDEGLCKIIEPNVAGTFERAAALNAFHERGIPTIVWLGPILPFINDTEENLRGVLKHCFDASVTGILFFGAGVTLREGDREYFYKKLDEHFPGLKQKYHDRYGYSYGIDSPNAAHLMKVFRDECAKHDVISDVGACFRFMGELPERQIGMELVIDSSG